MTDEIYTCLECGKPVPDYKPQICCNAYGCPCRGLPIEPPICSEECWDNFMIGSPPGRDGHELL